MDIPTKTLKSGFSLPVYGLGTWLMGGKFSPEHEKDSIEIQAIRDAIEHGVTHIDTAEMYGGGHAEELIAEATQGVDRSTLQLTSKVSVGMHDGYEGVIRSCEASLKRLKTDYLDLYLLHRYPHVDDRPEEEIMRALDYLVEQGLVRNIGVCNMTVNRFDHLQNLTANKLVCNQVHYSVQCREPEVKGLVQQCIEGDTFLVAWGALQKGTLQQNELLGELAKKYGKTQYQIALNWVIAQKNTVTIPKTTSIEHLQENLGALGWQLEEDDVRHLSTHFPDQLSESDRVPLDYEAQLKP